MSLSCSCEDFDKGEWENWWEPGGRSVPPPGTCCRECDAPLPAVPHACIEHYEVYDPAEPMPPHPDDVMGDEPDCQVLTRHWNGAYDRLEAAREAWEAEHGYDSDYERCERHASTDYRCERCEGLAAAIEDLGYCGINPGELISAHVEYVEQSGGHEVVWKRDAAGVLQPRRMTRRDFVERELRRRLRRAHYIVLRGGWRHEIAMIWIRTRGRVESAIMPRLGYVYRYDYDAKRYRWKRRLDGTVIRRER